jgi:hypothetical protein
MRIDDDEDVQLRRIAPNPRSNPGCGTNSELYAGIHAIDCPGARLHGGSCAIWSGICEVEGAAGFSSS